MRKINATEKISENFFLEVLEKDFQKFSQLRLFYDLFFSNGFRA